ncbi:thioredoxin family protein [Legionella sp. MW5194]|uniref:thioredoxin family protein n=1 Tax=Legionella sp. MW5194 TaxID=2662448 RepID=UPI00193D7007|nr:thioredoxin family protein [Legionella sp. MW5194]
MKRLVIGLMVCSLPILAWEAGAVTQPTVQAVHFTPSQFEKAKRSNLRFIVAFHKKDCARCKKQQQILNELALSPELVALRLLIADFDDAELVKQFDVSFHDTLIVYRGPREVSRSQGLLNARAIRQQITG